MCKIVISKKVFECEKCKYKSDSLRGLKTHMNRKHKQDEGMSFPVSCELYNYEVKDKWIWKSTW